MDIFTPVVPVERRHQHFNAITADGFESTRQVLQDWAEGFPDRDGKFAMEFQTTFNSCFWELYLHAAFRDLAFTHNFDHIAPDFFCTRGLSSFVAEAAIASHATGYAAEWEVDLSNPVTWEDRKPAMLEYASIRLANAFDGKLKKYRSSYGALPHVVGRPFVVCLAPFEQPFSYSQAERALRRVLYGFDVPLWMDDEDRGVRVILGEALTEQAWKPSGSSVRFGLFNDESCREVSAVIYSSTATMGKVRAFAPHRELLSVFKAVRYNASSTEPTQVVERQGAYRESLLDGLHLFLNPHAAVPLDPTAFSGREIAVHHGYDQECGIPISVVPDGFLFSRSVVSIRTTSGPPQRPEPGHRSPALRLPSIEPWPDGELHHVGGTVATFTNHYIAHYRGWTVVVAQDLVDGDWGAKACSGIYRDLFSWIEASKTEGVGRLLLREFLATPKDALLAITPKVDDACANKDP